MFVIKITKEDNLDRALKILKSKVQKTGLIQELRERQEYVKPSVKRRNEIKKAAYREKKYGKKD